MKLNRIFGLTLPAIVLIVGAVFLPAGSECGTVTENHVDDTGLSQEYINLTQKILNLTPEELNNLYLEYNITENDIKFAKGELPHYLEGTILDGNTRVIISSTGEPLNGEIPGVDFDVMISTEEADAIFKEAIEKYIQTFGVDPRNEKIAFVNGVAVPREYVSKLLICQGINSGKVEPCFYYDTNGISGIQMEECVEAIRDWKKGFLTKASVVRVVELWFSEKNCS